MSDLHPRDTEALDVVTLLGQESSQQKRYHKGNTPMIRLQAGNKGRHKRLHGGGMAAGWVVSVPAATIAVHAGWMEDRAVRRRAPSGDHGLGSGTILDIDKIILRRRGYKGNTPMIWLQAGYKGGHKRLHGGGRAARLLVPVFAATSRGSWGLG